MKFREYLKEISVKTDGKRSLNSVLRSVKNKTITFSDLKQLARQLAVKVSKTSDYDSVAKDVIFSLINGKETIHNKSLFY